MDAYIVAILTVSAIYAVLALALNLQFGTTGLINFGVVGFYGLGAYTSGLVTLGFDAPFVVGLLAAMAAGALAGAALASLSLRLAGDFLAIVTLGFAEAVRLVLNNEDWLTGGPRGLLIQERPIPAGLDRDTTSYFYLLLVLLLLAATLIVLSRLSRSPYGRVLRAIREDDLVPATLGKPVFTYRLQVFVIGSMVMAAAGSFYAHYVQTITPDNFITPVAILVWMSVVVGGAGNNLGVMLGALVVTLIYEGTRFIAPLAGWMSAEQVSSLRFIIIGLLLIVAIRFRPEGLLPERPVAPAPDPRVVPPPPVPPGNMRG